MKKVTYYCDLCKNEILKPKEEDSCTQVVVQTLHDWNTDLPIARVWHDIKICKACREDLLCRIKNMERNIDQLEK